MAQQNTFKNVLQESKLQTLDTFSTMLSFLHENHYIEIHDTFSKRWMVGISLMLCIRISSPTKSWHSLLILVPRCCFVTHLLRKSFSQVKSPRVHLQHQLHHALFCLTFRMHAFYTCHANECHCQWLTWKLYAYLQYRGLRQKFFRRGGSTMLYACSCVLLYVHVHIYTCKIEKFQQGMNRPSLPWLLQCYISMITFSVDHNLGI